MTNAELIARDLEVLWHPCTHTRDHETLPPVPVRRGEGVWLEDFEGNRYIDAVSSCSANLFGHANPRVNTAVREQLELFAHVTLAGLSHEPVVSLSERLVEITPPGLRRCFYADNDSAALEAALRMSCHYWRNQGWPGKRKVIALENSCHGDTRAPGPMEAVIAPSPDWYRREPGETPAACAKRRFRELEALLERHARETAAVIVEPLVQCAGGMRMYDPVYLSLLRRACHRYRVHLIADEITVGFGRTGTLFACEQADISPDFLCLSKGLTAGYLPLSVVLTTDAVYEALGGGHHERQAFVHSPGYAGNPLACSAALATLDIFEEDDVIGRNRELARRMREAAAPLEDHPHIGEVRQRGMTLAVEMARDKQTRAPYPPQERRGRTVYRHALTRGVLLHPIGDAVYMMPPYVITPEQIDHVLQVAREGIELATRD